MSTSSQKPIPFSVDGLKLYGQLHMPQMDPIATVVGCHGLMSDKNSPKQIALADRCVQMRMAYFRFDHRGCGESEGVFNSDTTLENRKSDLLAAVDTAAEAVGANRPIGLFGSSLGGSICLAAAQRIKPFAMVTLASPVRSRSIRFPEHSPDSLKQEIMRNRLDFNLVDQIQSIHHIMVIHGECDETVPVDNAWAILRHVGGPKREIILEDGDHRISRPDHQKRFIEETSQWFVRCYREQFPNAT